MTVDFDDSDRPFRVVVNDEGQYSIWPEHRALPPGWTETGTADSKRACLEHIERVWRDLTPRSIRGRRDDSDD